MRAIADLLVPAITEHVTTQEERDLLELPVRLGGLGQVNPARIASQEYEVSVKITGPLVRQIVEQAHESPDETEIKTLQSSARREKDEWLKMQFEQVRESLPGKTERAIELALEKGASDWLTVIPIREMTFNLNKRKFRDAIKLRYDWEITDIPAICTCGDLFTVDHAMVCRRGGLIIQRHSEIRDLEAEMLRMVCKRFHSRLAELLALKKGDDYATTISWIRAKVSFAILRSALLCLRGTRSKRRAANVSDIDITSESVQARI